MPRIYDEINDPFDYCNECWEPERSIEMGSGSYGDEHPPYSECNYRCEVCGALLTDLDN